MDVRDGDRLAAADVTEVQFVGAVPQDLEHGTVGEQPGLR